MASAAALVATMFTAGPASAENSVGSLALPFTPPGNPVRLCLDVLGGSSADFTPVQIHVCNLTAAQRWTVVPLPGQVRIFDKCLDIEGGSKQIGAKVDLYHCNGTDAQKWVYQPGNTLFNPASQMCLDDPGRSTTDTQVQIWVCNGTQSQNWELVAPF